MSTFYQFRKKPQVGTKIYHLTMTFPLLEDQQRQQKFQFTRSIKNLQNMFSPMKKKKKTTIQGKLEFESSTLE